MPKDVFVYQGTAYQKMQDGSAFDPETKNSIKLDFYIMVDYIGFGIWPEADSLATYDNLDTVEIMSEQTEIGRSAGHQLSTFKKVVDQQDHAQWVATCAKCKRDVTVWPSGITYSILGNVCE